jgi:hypothetical protein
MRAYTNGLLAAAHLAVFPVFLLFPVSVTRATAFDVAVDSTSLTSIKWLRS